MAHFGLKVFGSLYSLSGYVQSSLEMDVSSMWTRKLSFDFKLGFYDFFIFILGMIL